MILLIAVVVGVVLAGLALFTASWGRPRRHGSTIEDDHVARSQQANWRGGFL
jgi:hypothetical protein